MKNLRFRSFTLWHVVLMIVLSLAFLGLFSISRSSAQDDEDEDERGISPARMMSEELFGPFDYDAFLERINNGEIPSQDGDVDAVSPYNSLVNNNAGATGTGFFTQSETTIAAFGNTVV